MTIKLLERSARSAFYATPFNSSDPRINPQIQIQKVEKKCFALKFPPLFIQFIPGYLFAYKRSKKAARFHFPAKVCGKGYLINPCHRKYSAFETFVCSANISRGSIAFPVSRWKNGEFSSYLPRARETASVLYRKSNKCSESDRRGVAPRFFRPNWASGESTVARRWRKLMVCPHVPGKFGAACSV